MPRAQLLQQAREAGAHALILRDMSLDGAAMKAFADVLRRDGLRPRVLQSYLAPGSMRRAMPTNCCRKRWAPRN